MLNGFRQIKMLACLLWTFAAAGMVWLNAGCDNENHSSILPNGDHAIFIVCEGNYGTSNASLDIIDTFYTDTIHRNVFNRVNESRLGGYAHRMLIVDTFGLIAVTAHHQVKVIHTGTFELLQTFTVRSPRDAVFSEGSIFISSYMDSQIVIVRYPSWEIQDMKKIAHKPNHLAAMAGKIFISNSDTFFSRAQQDTMITVMDALPPYGYHTITAGKTPVDLVADPYQEKVFIACKGSLSESGSILVLDARSEQGVLTIAQPDIRPVQLSLHDSLLACIISDNGYVRVYNSRTGDGKGQININASAVAFCGGNLLVADASDYISSARIYMMDTQYTILRSFRTGISPAHIVSRR